MFHRLPFRSRSEYVGPAINNNPNQVTVRVSFSKHNIKVEVDRVVGQLKELV